MLVLAFSRLLCKPEIPSALSPLWLRLGECSKPLEPSGVTVMVFACTIDEYAEQVVPGWEDKSLRLSLAICQTA